MFCVPLGFTVTSTSKDREDALIAHLGPLNNSQFLWVLNPVFNVNFKIGSEYSLLAEHEKQKHLIKFITELVVKCFTELWVVMIDDADNTDEESLALLRTIITLNRIIFVLSCRDTGREMHPGIMKMGRVLNLTGLDKWYHAGLACQFLNVVAIPPELEKYIYLFFNQLNFLINLNEKYRIFHCFQELYKKEVSVIPAGSRVTW